MNDYEMMIQRMNSDFQLELENPEEYNISEEIRGNNEYLLEDLELLATFRK